VIEPVDETNPKWFITPGSGSLGTADEDRVDRVFVRFIDSATGIRNTASYPATSPVGGIEKQKDLITNRAPMTLAAAQAEAQAIWSELAGRSGFTSGWTLTRGQVTAKGGPLVDLAFIEAGDAVCALGAPDPRGVALNTNVVLGETDYQWAEDELQANPVGAAARDTEAVLEQVGNLAVSAMAAAAANRSGDTGWIDVVFQNGWVNFDVRTVQYRRKDGEVQMRGLAKNGALNVPAFTLPPGFRPPARNPYDNYFAVPSNNAHATVAVTGDGTVRVESGNPVWVSFDDVRFLVD
jgi:hypothetical protein